jgi:hypothetical protein
MMVVLISELSLSDLRLLGNNFSRRRRRSPLSLAAVNRSLALHGDSVDRLSLKLAKASRPPRSGLMAP